MKIVGEKCGKKKPLSLDDLEQGKVYKWTSNGGQVEVTVP